MTNKELEAIIASVAVGKESPHDVSADDLRSLAELNPAGPYHFVNLLKYKAQADYPADHPMAEKPMSGRDAYNLYGLVALQQVTMRGGRLMQSNLVEFSMGKGGNWDSVATMEYQNIGAFFEMLADPDYQDALVHREAGLETTEVIVTRPMIKEPVGSK